MKPASDPKLYYVISVVCAIWFMSTAWIWVYGANLVISLPIGLVGIACWYKARKLDPRNKANKAVLAIYTIGFALSIMVFLLLRVSS